MERNLDKILKLLSITIFQALTYFDKILHLGYTLIKKNKRTQLFDNFQRISSSGFTMANSVADPGFPKGCGANPRRGGGVNAENCIKMRLRGTRPSQDPPLVIGPSLPVSEEISQ